MRHPEPLAHRPLLVALLLTVAMVATAGGCGGSSQTPPDAGGDGAPVVDGAPASDAADGATDATGGDGPGGDLPPVVCKPPAKTPEGRWFTDVSEELGLGTADAPTVLGTSVRAGDLDGDGYPDLLATIGHIATREVATEPGAKPPRYRFLLMNRPHPDDPTGRRRILVDTTAESGLLATRDGAGGRGFSVANLGDLDGDGNLDVVVCPGVTGMGVVDGCAAFLNDGKARFTLAPAGALEQDVYQVASAALLDIDRDGVLDYWPGTFGTRPRLFLGRGDGTFDEVGAAWGLPQTDGDPATHESFRRVFGVTACDIDGDGDLDVLLANYGREHNQLWRNDGDRLTEIGEMLGVAADERMDYTDDESYRCYCQENPGACPPETPPSRIVCPGRGWVPGASDQPWRLGGNTFSIACGDLDNDGDMDLMTAEIRHWDVGSASDPSELLIQPGGPGKLLPFERPGNEATGLARTPTIPDWNEGDMMPVFADFDLDGRKDIYLSSSDYPETHGWLWRQREDGTFEDRSEPSGAAHAQAHGVAAVDLDLDGDLDLVIGTSTARGGAPNNALRVYRNDIGQDRNWLAVRLVGTGAGASNRSAIGARVSVRAGGVTQVQEVSGGYGHNSIQNDLVLTFGLGDACEAEEVEVRWPDAAGTVERFGPVRANYRVELEEGTGRVRYLKAAP